MVTPEVVRRVLELLHDAKPSGTGQWSARCPAHEDSRPSLSVGVGDDGRVLLHCHTGCTLQDILQALGLKEADLFPPQEGNGKPRIAATYDYCDECGNVLFQTVRFVPKDFRQRRPDGKGGWVWNLKGVPRVLYRLRELLKAPPDRPVFVVEGEKDVEALRALGLVATCNPMGAGKWRRGMNDYGLRDRSVYIIADNDDAGRGHAAEVLASLQGVARSAVVIELPGLPPKGDVSDWLNIAGNDKEGLLSLCRKAAEADGAKEGQAAGPKSAPDSPDCGAAAPTPPPSPSPPWPDPPDPAAYHGLAGDIVRAIEPASEADPVALLVQTLVAFGNAVGRGAHFHVEGDAHYCNEFVVCVGRSAKARKGTSWGRVRQLVEAVAEEYARDHIQSGLSSGEGLIWAVRDPATTRQAVKEGGRVVGYEEVESDPGVSDKRLLIHEAEFANVLKQTERHGNTLSVHLRNAWDGRDLRSMVKNCPDRATGPHVSIVGHITAEELARYLSATESANGFGNRFLWVCVQRSKALPFGGTPDAAAMSDLQVRLRAALEHAATVGDIGMDRAACDCWQAVYPELSDDRPGLAGALLSRAEAHVRRLAAIYALLDRHKMVGVPHLKAALALWEYVEASVAHIFGDDTGNPLADEILRSLRAAPQGLTRTEINNLLGRNHNATAIGKALEVLQQHRLAHFRSEATAGRPSERWFSGPTKETKETK
jgi:hypothetical protein